MGRKQPVVAGRFRPIAAYREGQESARSDHLGRAGNGLKALAETSQYQPSLAFVSSLRPSAAYMHSDHY